MRLRKVCHFVYIIKNFEHLKTMEVQQNNRRNIYEENKEDEEKRNVKDAHFVIIIFVRLYASLSCCFPLLPSIYFVHFLFEIIILIFLFVLFLCLSCILFSLAWINKFISTIFVDKINEIENNNKFLPTENTQWQNDRFLAQLVCWRVILQEFMRPNIIQQPDFHLPLPLFCCCYYFVLHHCEAQQRSWKWKLSFVQYWQYFI